MRAYDRVTARLVDVTGFHANGSGSDWRCPAHEDRSPSLSVTNGDDRVLVHCQAGCDVSAVLAALDLRPGDLFDEAKTATDDRHRIRESYGYIDEAGQLLFEVVRFDPKDFRQRRPDGNGGWIWKLGDTRRVLYRLPQVKAAVAAGLAVWVVEGEKDVHALERAGEVTTCNPGGAGKWRPEYADVLAGAREVIIVRDKDPAGMKHAADVEASLTGRVDHLLVVEARRGKDPADHLAAGLTVDDFDVIGDSDGATAAPPQFMDLAVAEFGVEGEDAADVARQLTERVARERLTVVARRVVRDQDLARDADLDGIDVATAGELVRRDRPPRRAVFGDLVAEGHNATVVARYKAGKSTLIENMARAAVTGGLFLARFPVAEPLRVAMLNYELDEDDMAGRIDGLGLDGDALERLLILNLRGRRLPIMTGAGRDWLADQLAAHSTDVMFPDPFGAAFAAAGGQSENDNAEVRRFTTALDEIKRLAGCRTLVMPVHTGRGEQPEGDERGRGATVLDDWPDVRMLLTVDDHGDRYLRTDGRAWCLQESRLGFDENQRRLMLATSDLGLNRRSARRYDRKELVVRLVRDNPGVNTTRLRDLLGANNVGHNEDKDQAIEDARSSRAIHVHDGARGAHLHYVGEPHDEDEDCEGEAAA